MTVGGEGTSPIRYCSSSSSPRPLSEVLPLSFRRFYYLRSGTFSFCFPSLGSSTVFLKMMIRVEGDMEDTTLLMYETTVPKENLNMVCGAFYIPKENVENPQGEDASFVYPEKRAIGVADGVGDWARKGVDAGEYARELMYNARSAIRRLPDGVVDPAKVLNEAFRKTKVRGSSTACIVMLKDDILHSINVGDSGFMIFRNNMPVYKSPIQQHSFNYPYHLGSSKYSDKPSSAGDIIVLRTDGLLDNVFPEEIEDLLEEQASEGVDPIELSTIIARDLALPNSFDEEFFSPFANAAHIAGKKYNGGKIDDITVVVAHNVAQI